MESDDAFRAQQDPRARPNLLPPSEIESLRREMQASSEWIRRAMDRDELERYIPPTSAGSAHRHSEVVMPSWTYDQLQIGTKEKITKKITEEDIRDYARLSLDKNPVHLDAAYAKNTQFGQQIAHGMYVASFISAVLGDNMPGHGTIYMSQQVKFKKPVFIGDTVTAWAEIVEKMEKKRVRIHTWVENQNGDVVIDGEAMCMLTQ